MVLEGLGCAEGGHHGVAGEFFHPSAGRLDLPLHRVVEPLEPEPSPLGILLVRERG